MGDTRKTERTKFPGIYKVTRGRAVRYVVSYRIRGVGQRTKTFERLADAKEFQGKARDPRHADRMRSRERGTVPVAAYFDSWLEAHNGLRPTTRRRYADIGRMYIAPSTLGRMNVSDVEREDVKLWIAWMQAAGVGAPTIDKAYRTLRACLTEAVKDGKLEGNPARAIRTPRANQRKHFYMTPSEIDAVAAQMPERERPLLRFLAYTGARIGEATALRIRDLDLLRRRVVIAESAAELAGRKLDPAPTKTGKTRIVPLFTDLADELAEYLERYGVRDQQGNLDREAFMFVGKRGSPIRQNNWRTRVFQPAAMRAGVVRPGKSEPEPPRVHDLRHTAASLMAAHGFTLLETSRILGHSSIKTTADLYADLFEDVTAERAERFGQALREERTRHAVVPLRDADQQ
jgi:integrase